MKSNKPDDKITYCSQADSLEMSYKLNRSNGLTLLEDDFDEEGDPKDPLT